MSDSSTQAIALQPPNTPYEMRPAGIHDLSALHQTFWQERTLETSREYLHRIIRARQSKRGYGVVVLDNETIIGYGQIMTLTRCHEISDLIVQPDYRSQGIGTAIIQQLCRTMKQHSKLPIEIGVAMSNLRAVALYERIGFKHKYYLELNLGNGVETVNYLALAIK